MDSMAAKERNEIKKRTGNQFARAQSWEQEITSS